MEIRKIYKYINLIIIVFIFLLFSSCKGQEKESKNIDEIKNSSSDFTREKKVLKDEENYKYKYTDVEYKLKYNKQLTYDLIINNTFYPINLQLESTHIDIYSYKNKEKRVILIEGDDHYGSIFYIYYLVENELFYLGIVNTKQTNVEEEGIFKKDFKISLNENQFKIVSYLNGKIYGTNTFKDKTKIRNDGQKSETLTNLVSKNQSTQWNGKYSCNFLRIKEENADPRAYGMIYINIDNNKATFKLDTYKEIIDKDLIIISSNPTEIILADHLEKNSKFIITKSGDKHELKSDLLNKIMEEDATYELENTE